MRRSSQDAEFEELEQVPLGTERCITREVDRKRKRIQKALDPTNRIQDVPA